MYVTVWIRGPCCGWSFSTAIDLSMIFSLRSSPSKYLSIIQASPRLVTLDVSGNDQLSTGCMEVLIAVLEMGSIQRLLMSACGMTVPNQQQTVAMEGLVEKLQASCCVLHHLDISDSSLSNPQVEILRSLLNPFTKSLVM